jgi:transposase
MTHTQEACDRYIKAYKKVEKLSKTMKKDEIAQILGRGKSLVEEYIRILNKEELLMGETSYGNCRNLSIKLEFSKKSWVKNHLLQEHIRRDLLDVLQEFVLIHNAIINYSHHQENST